MNRSQSASRLYAPYANWPSILRSSWAKTGTTCISAANVSTYSFGPVPSAETLKHIYSFENSYQLQDKMIYDDSTIFLKKTRVSLKQIESSCPRPGRLLDVGCSSGGILWLAKRNGGFSVCGVEIYKDTAEIARDNGAEVFVGDLGSASYPRSQASALLQPDGVIVLVTPNYDAIFPLLTYWLYRLLHMPWSHATPPYHLHQFSETSLDNLVQKLNLTVVEKQYRGCTLRYELGETHVVRALREQCATVG